MVSELISSKKLITINLDIFDDVPDNKIDEIITFDSGADKSACERNR